jgi:hypothetical protein
LVQGNNIGGVLVYIEGHIHLPRIILFYFERNSARKCSFEQHQCYNWNKNC